MSSLCGKKISGALQAEINKQEQRLQEAKTELIETRSSTKAIEAEAQARAKEIESEAKIEAAGTIKEIEKKEARLEEKEKTLDEKVHEVERQRKSLENSNKDVENLKVELSEASAKHRDELEKVAKLSQTDAKDILMKESRKRVWRPLRRSG